MHDDLTHHSLVVLRDLVLRHVAGGVTQTAIPGLRLHFSTEPTPPNAGVFEPAVCLVLQGAKQVIIGERQLRYDPASYFVASVELPATGCISQASAAEPYVAVSLTIDRDALASLMAEAANDSDQASGETAGFAVSPVTGPLLGSVHRLVELLDSPHDIAVLAPLLRREILYRLLKGEQAAMLRQIARADSRLSQVHRAIGWIRANIDANVRVGALAGLAGMSKASFHRHFKAATAMSPLQYQKTLRLQEARRLLLANSDAQHAAYSVGYQSASQFSREYARLFGVPPARDAVRLRRDPVEALPV